MKTYNTKTELLIFLLVLPLLFLGCQKREIKNIGSTGKGIICFGDSITFGYGANPGEDYPNALAKLVDIPVTNAGVDGDTTRQALSRIKKDVLEKKPLLVIVEFCGNDFIKKVPFNETAANLREMIKAIQADGAMVALVDISAGMFLSKYRKEYAEIAKEQDAIFIPGILSKILTNPSMKSDFLHPNANGYKEIANRIYRRISPYLQENQKLKSLQNNARR